MLKNSCLVAAALALGGCASMRNLDSEVSTYSQWPAERKPAAYVFERLPSQQSRPEQQATLEDAARPAIEAAGFTPAADERSADYSVQVGARVSANQRWPYDDPFGWNGGFRHGLGLGFGFGHGYSRFGLGLGFYPGWGPYSNAYRYEREVAVLIRDRKTGQAVYEARANNDGNASFGDGTLPAMFEAAMKDFPYAGVNPRQVTVELSRAP